jgi:hypothetical protein
MILRRFCSAVSSCLPMATRRLSPTEGDDLRRASALPVSHSSLFFRLVLLVCLTPASLLAQGSNATLNGQITDPHGRVVPNTEVQVVNLDTNVVYPTKSNGDGLYTLPSLPPGRYRVHVRREGFKDVNVTDLTLHTQDALQQNFQLEVGSTLESVTVNASATNNSPSLGLTVERDFIQDIPLNGRTLDDLLLLTPGAVNGDAGSGYSVNGQRGDANYYTLDGVGANTGISPYNSNPLVDYGGTTPGGLPNLDSLEEFKVQTSGYTAEYGRQPGGQFELRTRSGTNTLNGSLFDYFRNTVLDANSWFFNHETPQIPRQPEHQNDFGGALGGPVLLPGIFSGKDRDFYFFSYEGLRLEQPEFATGSVPSLSFRKFAAASIQPFLNAAAIPNGPDNNDQCVQSLDPVGY